MAIHLRDRLAAIPNTEVPIAPSVLDAIAGSERYLASTEALESIEIDFWRAEWGSSPGIGRAKGAGGARRPRERNRPSRARRVR